MTHFIRPCDGAARQGAHIDLNVRKLKAGDRVLYEVRYGEPRIGTISDVVANAMWIDGEKMLVTAAHARFRPQREATWEEKLVAALRASYAASPVAYKDERQRLVRSARQK